VSSAVIVSECKNALLCSFEDSPRICICLSLIHTAMNFNDEVTVVQIDDILRQVREPKITEGTAA